MRRLSLEPTRKIAERLLNAQNFDQLYRCYGERLVQSMTSVMRDHNRAEEIAARAFERAWEKRETFRGSSQPSTWVEAIARNEARRLYNRKRARQFDPIDGVEALQVIAPELVAEELEKREERERLKFALNQLPDRHRRALTAHFVEGFSIRQIANDEAVPVGTVLSRIHTAKELLRQAWDRYSPGMEPEHSPDLTLSR
jgi:RNA polymerase sigma-70 factor (ECF subfamily)